MNTLSREDYNKKMRDYFKENPLKNAFHCHNLERRSIGYSNISFEEYLSYREFIGLNSVGKLKSNKNSNILLWEKQKKNLVFIKKEFLFCIFRL